LPLDLADRTQRIRAVKTELDAIKTSREARIVFEALTTCGYLPAWSARHWVDLFARWAALVVTYVAGPRRPIRVAGHRIDEIVPLVPSTGPIGVGLSICSYAGRLRIGVLADTAVLPDADRLVRSLDDGLRP
jgi:hypothetical protein